MPELPVGKSVLVCCNPLILSTCKQGRGFIPDLVICVIFILPIGYLPIILVICVIFRKTSVKF